MTYGGILTILLVVAVLAVSGCSGGSSTTNPTATAGASTGPTATPTESESMTASSIFDTSNLNFYEWRIVSRENGEEDTVSFRIERGTEPYKGAATNFKMWTITTEGEDPSTLKVYFDAAGNAIGAISDGEELSAEFVPGMSTVFDALDIGQIWGAANYPLSNSLPETLTINGKTYVCKKWAVGNFAGNAAVWTSTVKDVQMAVKIQYGNNQGDSWTYQLWDWG